MDSYLKKWREWRNGDLGSKPSTFMKGVEKDEKRIANQSINNSTNRFNVNILNKILTFQ